MDQPRQKSSGSGKRGKAPKGLPATQGSKGSKGGKGRPSSKAERSAAGAPPSTSQGQLGRPAQGGPTPGGPGRFAGGPAAPNDATLAHLALQRLDFAELCRLAEASPEHECSEVLLTGVAHLLAADLTWPHLLGALNLLAALATHQTWLHGPGLGLRLAGLVDVLLGW